MIKNVESLTDISYVSVFSDPGKSTEEPDKTERLERYCRFMDIAVIICEVVALASIATAAFVIG